MENIEKTLNDYFTLHSFEKKENISTWNQTRLVTVYRDGNPTIMMRPLTLGEKIKTILFKWKPTDENLVKNIIETANLPDSLRNISSSDEPVTLKQALNSKVSTIFKKIGNLKVYEKFEGPNENKGYNFKLLSIACDSGNITTLKRLLSTSSVRSQIDDLDENKQTLLMRAAIKGNYEVVKELLKAGADKGIIYENNKNAFALANDNGHTAIAKLIASSNYPKY